MSTTFGVVSGTGAAERRGCSRHCDLLPVCSRSNSSCTNQVHLSVKITRWEGFVAEERSCHITFARVMKDVANIDCVFRQSFRRDWNLTRWEGLCPGLVSWSTMEALGLLLPRTQAHPTPSFQSSRQSWRRADGRFHCSNTLP
jgi:hypothetical protein